MKLSLRFNALAINPSVFFLLGFWKFEAELEEEEEAIGASETVCENGTMAWFVMGLRGFVLVSPIKSFSKWAFQLGHSIWVPDWA